MSTEPVNYEAVLADLEARKAQLEAAIIVLRQIMGQSPPDGIGSPLGGPPGGAPKPDAFLGMSIPDATKKHLTAIRRKQSTQEVISALKAGGLHPSDKYAVMYNILRRREKQVGDIINIKGDWALAEWHPNYRKPTAKSKDGSKVTDHEEVNETTVGEKKVAS